MICGLAGLVLFFVLVPSIVALVLGLVAASRIKASGGRLTGMAVARIGWITGLVGVVGGAAFITAAVLGAFDEETSVFDLDVGDCVEVPVGSETAELNTVPVVDCDEPHNGEVFFVGEINPDRDRDYPSSDEDLFSEIAEQCIGARTGGTSPFEEYVGLNYQESVYFLYPVAPDERAWEPTRGQYVCVATLGESGETLTGSIEGSER